MPRYIPPIVSATEWIRLSRAVDEEKYEETFQRLYDAPGFADEFQQIYAELIEVLDEKDYARYVAYHVARKLE